MKQCDKSSAKNYGGTISASSAGTAFRCNHGGKSKSGSRKPSNSALKRLPCHTCGKYGHWKSSHRDDGTLHPDTKVFDTADQFAASLGSSDSTSKSYSNTKKTISFNMANIFSSTSTTKNCTFVDPFLGPLVDDGAPYSAIGNIELRLLQDQFGYEIDAQFDSIPDSLDGHTHWQYGIGQHSSAPRRILGSVLLSAQADSGRKVNIRHLVLDGSSQWVIGRNVTSNANLIHVGKNALQIVKDGITNHISMVNRKFLSYVPLSRFNDHNEGLSVLSGLSGNFLYSKPWSKVKGIVDKVHKHVCGHATLTDIRILLERNDMWNAAVEEYVSQLLQRCRSCRATAPPQPSRKVSISSLSKSLNEVVCVDHFYLENFRLFHAMDLTTRFSAAYVVSTASMDDSVMAFEACWLSQFWIPESVRADKSFLCGSFESFCDSRDIKISPVPPHRHSKNAIESKHGIIRSVFLKMKHAPPDVSHELLAMRAVSVSNDLYGNDLMSSFELAKGFTKPVIHRSITEIPDDVVNAQIKLQAKRKLALILKSKATFEELISVGDMVETYNATGMNKRGVWSTPKDLSAS